MDNIREYKCLCCGAPLVFDASEQNMKCDSCGNVFSAETLEQLDMAQKVESMPSKYDWNKYEPRDFDSDSAATLSDYSCPSCGAEVIGDITTGATVCPYCGNTNIIKKQFENNLMPDYLIPFRLDKKQATEKFEEACKKLPFLPDSFKGEKRIAEMVGTYVPFWMFDCDCEADISYSAETVTSWSDSRYNYVKTDYYKLLRSGKIEFSNIPVDGSRKADDAYMESIEPFDCSDAVNFNTSYLSGFVADKYDVSAEESIERANNRVKNSTEEAFRSTTDGYSAVVPTSSRIAFSNGKIRYALLPVWMMNIKYNGELFRYALNGQTGKVAGKYPISKAKKWFYFAKMYAAALALCTIGYAIYLVI